MIPSVLVFDASPLNYFARASSLDTLRVLVGSAKCLTTVTVQDELLLGAPKHAQLYLAADAPWIEVVEDSSISTLQLMAQYIERFGSTEKNLGEATVLAYAESRGYAAVVDDRAAFRAGTDRGVEVISSLKLICVGIRTGVLTEAEAEDLVDLLCAYEAYFPCSGEEFLDWARQEGLLA